MSDENMIRIRVHESAPPEGATYGTPSEDGKCPKCGSKILQGYGLACGPGFGPYEVCENFCGWSWKIARPESEE